MGQLRLTLVQTDILWEDIPGNLDKLNKITDKIQDTDLIILPEAFPTGFTMDVEKFSEYPDGRSISWMQEKAFKKNMAITGSLFVKEENAYYNRLYFVKPDGSTYTYDKRHLFAIGGESHKLSRGSSKTIIEYKGWKILPLICYDIRFPVWSRFRMDYDLLIYVANWPGVRRDVWNTLLKARAIENLSYVAGVNRFGIDGRDIIYTGDSNVFDFKGESQCERTKDNDSTFTTTINKYSLETFRHKFPVHLDGDNFTISE